MTQNKDHTFGKANTHVSQWTTPAMTHAQPSIQKEKHKGLLNLYRKIKLIVKYYCVKDMANPIL